MQAIALIKLLTQAIEEGLSPQAEVIIEAPFSASHTEIKAQTSSLIIPVSSITRGNSMGNSFGVHKTKPYIKINGSALWGMNFGLENSE